MDKPITDLLPHRDPFLFIDRIVSADKKGCVGERTFKDTEWFFKGHFPGYPVVPGVILTETMAQCGGAGIVAAGLIENKIFLLAALEGVRFRRQVRPNETVRIEVEITKFSQRLVKQRGKVFVGDELAAEGEWICIMLEKGKGA